MPGESNSAPPTPPIAREGGIDQSYFINVAQLRHRFLPTPNVLNELSVQLVRWHHDEGQLVPGPQRTYPSIQLGTATFPLELNNDYTVPWARDTALTTKPVLAQYLNRGDRKNDLNNFSPRLSVSWDPFGTNRTFLRGGAGIIYDRVPSFIGFQERRDATWRTYSFTDPRTTDPAVLRQRV